MENLQAVGIIESYITCHVSSVSFPDIQEMLYKNKSNRMLIAAEFHSVSSDYSLLGYNILRLPTDDNFHTLSG